MKYQPSLIKYIMTVFLPKLVFGFFFSNDEFGDVPIFPEKRGQRDIPYFLKYLDRKFEQLFHSLLSSCTVVPSTESSNRTKSWPNHLQVLWTSSDLGCQRDSWVG